MTTQALFNTPTWCTVTMGSMRTNRCAYDCHRFSMGTDLAVAIPTLPDDVICLIWAKLWQDEAARMIQCAVRAAIARSHGNPWDLPALLDVSGCGPMDTIPQTSCSSSSMRM